MIGDQAFWSGLRAAALHGLGKRYSWGDLQRHFEMSSGRNLEIFFRQWIERPGAPQLRLTDVTVRPITTGWQVSGILGQEEPFYNLAVVLSLDTLGSPQEHTVALSEHEGHFAFTVTDQPIRLTVDPESSLFRRLYSEELPATVNNLRASRVPLVVIANGSEALLDASRDLLRGLQWQQAPVLSESEYLAQHPGHTDMLVLGWPENPALRPTLPEGFRVTGQQFELGDKLYNEANDVLFIVTDGPENRGVTAYFLPLSVAAAQDSARRIPHYGRYSALVFHNGQNQVKSTWESTRSPLKIFFVKESSP
jgi:hypothetical protein